MTERLEPDPSAPAPSGKDLSLEGLRGFAALAVLYAHLTPPLAKLDPGFIPDPIWWRFEFGGGAVLLFFVLSGYVIGLSNRRSASPHGAREFWVRRFWRLAPINVLAVVLAWVALPSIPVRDLAGNLLFLQDQHPIFGFRVPLLSSNTNLWSLHYEMVYYLAFPLVWSLRPRTAVLGTVLVMLAALRLGVPSLAFLSNLAAGGTFWFTGLWLAWRGPAAPGGLPRVGWPTALLLFFVACRTQVAITLAQRAGLAFPWAPEVNLWNLDLLPSAVLLIAALAGRDPPFPRTCLGLALGLPALRILWQMAGHQGLPLPGFSLYGCLWLLAVALLAWRPRREAWQALAPVGAISYALYAVAAPVQTWVLSRSSLPQGSLGTYLLRLGVVVIAALLLAWLAEARFQPALIARLRRRAPGSAAA